LPSTCNIAEDLHSKFQFHISEWSARATVDHNDEWWRPEMRLATLLLPEDQNCFDMID
jgi:hypothetical protein